MSAVSALIAERRGHGLPVIPSEVDLSALAESMGMSPWSLLAAIGDELHAGPLRALNESPHCATCSCSLLARQQSDQADEVIR